MLPITTVILYKHGVGYFQRAGNISDDQLIELSFKTNQMNDVLKSLTTLDFDGGSFGALSYDSEEPIERRLSELNMNIPERGAFAPFLDRLKGARISLTRTDKTLTGKVVGIEYVAHNTDTGQVEQPHLALLTSEGSLLRIPLLEVDQLRFEDDNIRRDLHTLLDILFSSLRKDHKRLSIQALGSGQRQVSIGYVIEAPVWKTSYRLVLPDGQNKVKPLLQGWALVDNTTDDDWTGVKLSLIAGLPISFVHDLYSARYRQRPVIRVDEESAVAPPLIEGNLREEAYAMDSERIAPPAKRAKRPLAKAAPAVMSMAQTAQDSLKVQTRTQEVGDLFAYEITHPVDIGRGRSALVPILQNTIDAERVVLFNREVREKNPMSAFRLKNNTGLTLEGGPLTVFEQGNYVGEAMLETMRREEKRIVPYSVELGVVVLQQVHNRREYLGRISKHGQTIHRYYRELLITQYQFRSRLDRELQCFLDHRPTYPTRENTPEPEETTDNFWRFRFNLPAHKTQEYTVTEVAQQAESFYLPGLYIEQINQMVEQQRIDDNTRLELESIANLTEQIAQLEEQRDERLTKIQKIESGQSRLRENIKTMGTSAEEASLRQKYIRKLSEQEELIDAETKKIENITQLIKKLEKQREEQIQHLDIESD